MNVDGVDIPRRKDLRIGVRTRDGSCLPVKTGMRRRYKLHFWNLTVHTNMMQAVIGSIEVFV